VTERTGVEGLEGDFVAHRALMGTSNAVYTKALEVLQALLCGPGAERAIVERMERAWRNRTFRATYERPLLLLATLRYDMLRAGPEHPLAVAFADASPLANYVTRAALASALDPDRLPLWLTLATRKVQTNDVSRSIAWRWPAALADGRPIALVDIGCAAGLNLVADRLPPTWMDDAGRPIVVDGGPVILRQGFDAEPIDLTTGDEEALWLRSCIWPGDAARLDRLQQAIAAFIVAQSEPVAPQIARVRVGQVARRLRRIDSEIDRNALIVVTQTFVRDYAEPPEAEMYAQEMEAWLAEVPRGRAVWMQMELAADRGRFPAELVAHPSHGRPIRIARCSYHPTTIEVVHDAVAKLRPALAHPR
jgi:hypothetical protein